MKHAKKMMLVPYVKPIENPNMSKIHELDAKMSEILKSNEPPAAKMKLYTQALNAFMTQYDEKKLWVDTIANRYDK